MRSTPVKLLLAFILIGLLASGCSMQITPADAPTVTPSPGLLVTATLPVTFTPRPSATPLPATALPTAEPILGTATTQINIRRNPGTGAEAVGMISAGTEVHIIGKDAGGVWLQVQYTQPDGSEGEGWAAAEYINVNSAVDIPVTSNNAEAAASLNGVSGSLTEAVNVRSGPGTNFDPLGLLAASTPVTLIGQDESGVWVQIVYTASQTGYGWVAAAYVASEALSDLPVITPEDLATAVPPTPTPEFTPAPEDNDSADDPAILVTFSTTSARAFSYSSDLSSPEGDAEDWVAFHPNTDEGVRVELLIDLECSGNGKLIVELWQGGIILTEWGELHCGDSDYALSMYRDETYQFRMRIKPSNKLQYIRYTLTMRANP